MLAQQIAIMLLNNKIFLRYNDRGHVFTPFKSILISYQNKGCLGNEQLSVRIDTCPFDGGKNLVVSSRKKTVNKRYDHKTQFRAYRVARQTPNEDARPPTKEYFDPSDRYFLHEWDSTGKSPIDCFVEPSSDVIANNGSRQSLRHPPVG